MKRILITAIILLAWAPAWAGSTTVVVGQGGAAPAGGTCGETPFFNPTEDEPAPYPIYGNALSQEVVVTGSTKICKLSLQTSANAGGGGDVTVQIRTASNGGGSLLGDAKTITTTGGESEVWHDVTWSSNYPTPTTTFYVFLIAANETINCLYGNTSVTGSLYMGESEFAQYDLQVKLYKME